MEIKKCLKERSGNKVREERRCSRENYEKRK